MPDREKVMQWLETCVGGCEEECPYEYKNLVYRVECKADLMRDALALLKEQEPVEPDGDNCGECGYTLHRINYDGPGKELRHEWFRFCPVCGKAVKWDDTD